MNKALDIEAVITIFLFFIGTTSILLLSAGPNFFDITSLSFKFSSESMAPFSFSFLGIFSLLSGAVFLWLSKTVPTYEDTWFRRLFIHPLNAALTTGAAGAAAIFTWALGFWLHDMDSNLILLTILVALFVLLSTTALAHIGDFYISNKLEKKEKKVAGYLILHFGCIVSIHSVVTHLAK